MRKWILLLPFLLLGCQENQTMVTYDDNTQVTIQAEAQMMTGFFGESELSCQYKITDTRIFGKFVMDGGSYIFNGDGKNNAFLVDMEGEEILLYIDDETLFGLQLSDQESIYASHVEVSAGVTEDTMAMMGEYHRLENTYYEGKKLIVTPIFNHLMYVQMIDYLPNEIIADHQLAVSVDDEYYLPMLEMSLKKDDRYGIIIEEGPFKGQYSEAIIIEQPDLVSLGIASNEKEAYLITTMLGNHLDKVIDLAHDFEKSGNEIKISDMVRIKKGYSMYIWLNKKLIESDEHLIITNSLTGVPDDMYGRIMTVPILSDDFETVLQGDKKDFIPSGYHIYDQVEGNLDRDNKEDIVMILEKDKHVILVLEKNQDYHLELMRDITGLTVDDIRIEDYKLILRVSGKDQNYWSESFIFDTLYDYRLIQSTYEIYDPSTKITKIFEYDFIDNEVIITQDGTSITRRKKLNEAIYLETFDGRYSRDYE